MFNPRSFPYSFASTSHFILTFSLSFTIVLGATLLGFQKHGLKKINKTNFLLYLYHQVAL